MGLDAYISGLKGENKACAFLKKENFTILERNFHSKFGEIDIIAKKDCIVHFIEVKFTEKDYELIYRINKSKYEKILKTVNYYLSKTNMQDDFQLDLLCINGDNFDFYENISF